MSSDPRLDHLRDLHASVSAASTARPDDRLVAYLEKVASQAPAITDDEVAALLLAGHSQDAIYEATVQTALAAAIERFEHGLRAVDELKESP
jgi:alkylhydroperoxidase family enzyme